jgi:hypothetical protein
MYTLLQPAAARPTGFQVATSAIVVQIDVWREQFGRDEYRVLLDVLAGAVSDRRAALERAATVVPLRALTE